MKGQVWGQKPTYLEEQSRRMERTWVLDDDIGVELNQPWNCLTFRLLIWENKLLYYLSYFNLGLWLFDWSTRVLLPVQKKQLPSSTPSHAISAASTLHGSPGCCCGWPLCCHHSDLRGHRPCFWLLHLKNGIIPFRSYPRNFHSSVQQRPKCNFSWNSWKVGGLWKGRTCAQ